MQNPLETQIKNLFANSSSRSVIVGGKKLLGFTLQKPSKKLQFGLQDSVLRKGAAYNFDGGKLTLFLVMRKEGRTFCYQGIYTNGKKHWYENIPDTSSTSINYEMHQRRLTKDEVTWIEEVCKNYFKQDKVVDSYVSDPEVDFVNL